MPLHVLRANGASSPSLVVDDLWSGLGLTASMLESGWTSPLERARDEQVLVVLRGCLDVDLFDDGATLWDGDVAIVPALARRRLFARVPTVLVVGR